MSLWDLVTQFYAFRLVGLVRRLTIIYVDTVRKRERGAGGEQPTEKQLAVARALLKECKGFCAKSGLVELAHKIHLSLLTLKDLANVNMSILEAEFRNVIQSLNLEIGKTKFVQVARDRTQYVNTEIDQTIRAGFPSAVFDLQEAASCLAIECGSACVFHSMRAAEHGLRALARDRRIRLPKKAPIELATWEEIIRALEGVEQQIQQYPKTLAREAQFDFYHGAMMEFKRFKNKFRNRIMHTREDYERDEALRAYGHVREFLRILSRRISQTKRSPVIWKGSKWTTIEP